MRFPDPFLQDAVKGFTSDQDKIVPPLETLARTRERIRTAGLDILEKSMRIDNGRLGIPVYFSICGHDAAKVTGTKKQMGKGATPEQAEASAIMELVERFSFFSFMKEKDNFLFKPRSSLKEKTIPYSRIAQSVHDDGETSEIVQDIFDALPLKWTPAFNLTRNESCLVPFDWFYAINAFNGPSAGNCREEAICQGISEVVERHVSALVSYRKLSVPMLSTNGITDPNVLEMLSKYAHAGVRLYLSDFSLDTGIPSIGALAMDPSTFPEKSEIVWTAGTTPDPQKALSRALTEVAQLAGDFNTSSNYVASGLPKPKSLASVSFITDVSRSVEISQLPNISHPNIRVEISRLVDALKGQSMEVLVIDTTHPLLSVPAFYTLIPGAYFRERTTGSSMGMFCAKLIVENLSPEKAIAALIHLDRKLPEKHYIQFYMGTCLLSMDDSENALEYFRRARALAPVNEDLPGIFAYMGVCLNHLGRFRESIDVLQEGIRYDAERTDLHNLLGFCHFKLREHETAIDHFKEVLRLDPTSAIDYANIASNYREMHENKKAIQYYEMALELDPSIEFARINLERLKEKSSSPTAGAVS